MFLVTEKSSSLTMRTCETRLTMIEGFVDGATLHVPFRLIVDLNGASFSAVYAVFDADPTGENLDILSWIRDRILQLGGDPLMAFLEPSQV